ncbi:MAG: hypothetical protein ACLP50_34815 [Solirubrobacteraceae bacterium]
MRGFYARLGVEITDWAPAAIADNSASAATTIPQPQAALVAAIYKQAAATFQPTNLAQIQSEAAAVQPMVDQLTREATASGNGAAVQELIDNTSLPGSPAVHEAILHDTPQYNVSSPASTVGPPSSTATAGADPCWGADNSVYNRHYWGGIWTAAWVSIVSNGWCGNGTAITWFPGFWGRGYIGVGYCFSNQSQDDGSWISYWGWVHGGHWAQIGLNVPLIGCETVPGTSGGATMREAANGYYDDSY